MSSTRTAIRRLGKALEGCILEDLLRQVDSGSAAARAAAVIRAPGFYLEVIHSPGDCRLVRLDSAEQGCGLVAQIVHHCHDVFGH